MDSSAGEAAALFGEPDPVADPFAIVVGGDSQDASGHSASGAETSHTQESSVASELFNGNADGVDFFSAAGALGGDTPSQYDAAYGNTTQAVHEYEASNGGASTAVASADYSQNYQGQNQQENGYYSAYQPAAGYAQRTQAYGTTAYDNPTQTYTQSTSTYNSYAPYGAVTSSSLGQPASISDASTAYDPYRPAAQSASTSYASQTTTYSTPQSSYDPYKPSQPAYDPYQPAQSTDISNNSHRPQAASRAASYNANVESSYAYSLTSAGARSSQAFGVPPPAPAPAPSMAAAPPHRPKTANAYDPPLPPPKPSRRVSSHVIYPGSPPPAEQAAPVPPPRGPPRKQTPISSDGYSSSTPSLYHPPSTQRYASPQQSAAYGGVPLAAQNGYASAGDYGVHSGAGHLNHTMQPSQPPARDHHRWDVVAQPTDPPFPPNPAVPSPLPAVAPQQAPLSPTLPREEGLVNTEQRPDPYAPNSGPSISPPASVNYSTHEPSPYEPPHVASPPQRVVSPWSTSGAPANGSTTSPSDYESVHALSHSAPQRTKSPGSASVRSVQSIQRQPFEQQHQGSASQKSPSMPPRRLTTDSTHKIVPNAYDPPLSDTRRATSPPTRISPNAYNPPPVTDVKRAASPTAMASRPPSVVSGTFDPYGSAANNRMRSASNGSVLSSISAVLEDPYTPSRHVRQQTGDSMKSVFERSPSNAYTTPASVAYDGPTQVLTVPHPVQTTYAPSPSLVGANDPLGRTSVRVPVVSFGFGGKLVTCFHGASASGGFDVALASRQSSEIKLQVLHKVIPESALDTSAASYPGPLFLDPGTPTTSLVRTAAATQAKTKKARVIKYLEERAEELDRGLGYFHSDSLEGRRAEGKLILVKLLKVMVENDGRLSGSPQIDAAVRNALSPRAAQPAPDALQLAASISTDMQSPSLAAASPYISLAATQNSTDAIIATHTLQSSHLDKIQEFLLQGERRAASHYASDQKLWAHAMVIASSIDKEAWKEVVTEFVRTELASRPQAPGAQAKAATDGREALRVAYSLFAGHGSASIQELVTPKPLAPTVSTLQVPLSSTSSITPVSASFPGPSEPMNILPDVLAKWADTIAMIYSSPLTFETSSTLTALGDQLAASHWYEAAHACYLLSPQTSPIGGIGSSSRMVLLGSPSPSVSLNFAKDPDPLIFSEVAEFALSLAPPAKGQEAFAGLPHLQPYRLIRAAGLAEMGHVQLANRYCEAISNCLNKNSPYINPTFLEQLRGLNDRLIAAPQLDKSGSWITSKVSKPSLDGIGSWVGGRLTKFIAGEDSPGPDQQTHGHQQQAFSGPFSQYSTISSTASSASPSPHQSTVNLAQTAGSPPPFRTGSAMGLRASAAPQINRASSAMDYTRPSLSRNSSPVPRVASANPATTTFADASLYSQALNGHAFGSSSKQSLNGYGTNGYGAQDDLSTADSDSPQSNGPAMGSWWGASDASATTPTASSFTQSDEPSVSTATSGQFISLMDDVSATPTAYQAHRSFTNSTIDEEEDDLGLGNASHRAKHQASEDGRRSESTPTPTNEEPQEESKPAKAEEKHAASSGGWLSRLWKRESTPSPVKANLGEQTSFYYDKELKRWVNKNAGPEATKSAQPPPPPRAQTTSPGASMRVLPSGTTPPPPPARPATTDPGDGMPKPPMRIRSNLVPPESDSSAPPTPMSATLPGQGPPPASRSRGAGKRPARSRYVDVLAQQQNS
ncbi:hypothetical protein DAEQUDRAFT_712916 [Daedalea quercina L-15889]|uniref:Protein transport protein sec16 n=1 Tax=Daedalea quercina L-15889 TaxID=1314783 RepID=A0A165P3S7_9APHY|nr:hypothetical protein DAEQUDRAFT_712916 [Daedalea quercina L-15889]